jgi:RNA recognition motif-containing protein
VNIFVGNLSFKATDDDLRVAFEAYGPVTAARVVKERDTGRSRGFGFVEMPNDEQARKAIAALDNQPVAGRPVKVNEAKPREDRPPR